MSENRLFIDTTQRIKDFAGPHSTLEDALYLLDRIKDIKLNYSLLKSSFRELYQNDEIEEEQLSDLVLLLLDHALALKKIRAYYLTSLHKAAALEKEISFYRKFLKDNNIDAPIRLSPLSSLDLTGKIRTITADVNWPRLFIVRVKRVFDVSATLAQNAQAFRHFADSLNNIAGPIFAWLAWLFYIPRLITNLLVFAKHVFPNRWMSQEEKDLGWKLRLKLQWQNLWFELANDLVWAAVGLINCFLLVGCLTPAAAYLTVALYSFDVILACIRAYKELNDIKQYKLQLKEDDSLSEPVKERMLTELNIKYRYECMRLGLSIATTTSLFIAMSLTIPVLTAVSPIFPMVGVSLVIVVCLVSYGLGKYFEKYKLNETLPEEIEEENCPQEGLVLSPA